MKPKYLKFKEYIDQSSNILVIQADNPDGDSLGSSIALEQILGKLNKEVDLYCAVQIPDYLKYLKAWSRVKNDLPNKIDLVIIVDTSTLNLLDKTKDFDIALIKSKPTIIIDHHDSELTIDFANLVITEDRPATGEIIYQIAKELNYEVNEEAAEALAVSILSDTIGLMTESTTSETFRIMAELVDLGVNLPRLDASRRESYQKSLELTKYKGRLLERIETYLEDRLAILIIPWEEIKTYSPMYNPSMLVLDDMRLIKNNRISVALKQYQDGRITAKIRSSLNYPYASELAESFGGGGHKYASGFKTYNYKDINELKKELVNKTNQILNKDNANI